MLLRLTTRTEKPIAEKHEIFEAEFTETSQYGNEGDFYSMEEFKQLENRQYSTW